MNAPFKIIIFCTLYAILNVAGATLIKKELIGRNLNSISSFLNLLQEFRVVGGFGIILFSALVMFKALSLGRFSVIIPLASGVNFLITIAVGIFIFKDRVSMSQLFGMFLIIAGIAAISYNQE